MATMRALSTWTQRLLPRKLFARTLLILVVPVLGVQLVLAAVFIQRHFEGVTRQMASAAGAEMNLLLNMLEQRGPDALLAETGALGLEKTWLPSDTIAPGAKLGWLDVSGRELARVLGSTITSPIFVDTVSERKIVRVDIDAPGGVLSVRVPDNRLMASNPHLLFTWMLFTSVVLLAISIVFLRNQVRPIRDLARAAEAFGKGHRRPFRPRGAEEVRRAGAAFISMRQRIERQIESRTTMLSGVSHDLRTPLTRMRLALEIAEPGPETDELLQDLAEMERMIEGFLAFARGEGSEASETVDCVKLIERLVADCRRAGLGLELSLDIAESTQPMLRLRPLAVTRALQNLLNNAHRYGTTVRLSLVLTDTSFEVSIEDDGPGIAPDLRQDAVQPFTRLDASRNQDGGGGVGLGLSIAVDVARSHGGALTLEESPDLGGLRAVFRLPR
ncbi:MAG: ATP-binding protein [Pseudomonadota bacterium]